MNMHSRSGWLLAFVMFCVLSVSGLYAQDTEEENGCVVTAPPTEMNLDPFYAKYCDVEGIPILSSVNVPDEALQEAWDIASHLLQAKPGLADALIKNKVKIGIIGANEVLSDLPDYKDIYTLFPGTDWDIRTRGVGSSPTLPMTSGAEENLLCYQKDVYRGENIFVHEFSHTVKQRGLQSLDPTFESTVLNAYHDALAKDLWADTYAASDVEEYWAEGVQSYFNVNLEVDPPNGIHNFVNTRAELEAYDPTLFGLIDALYKDLDWQPACPEGGPTQASLPCSGAGSAAVQIDFKNETDIPVEVFWANQACEETSYGTIEAGGQLTLSTFATHAWVVRGASGVLIQSYVAKEGPNPVDIQLPCSQGGAETQLKVQNDGSETLSLSWISYDCEEITYATIPPGQDVTQSTYANNVWTLRSEDGALLDIYILPEDPITITTP